MSDEVNNESNPAPESVNTDVGELKKSVDAQLNDVKSQLEAMNQGFAQSINSVTDALTAQNSQPVEEEYVDPSSPEYRAKIEAQIMEKVRKEQAVADKARMKKQQVLNSLSTEYPELNRQNSKMASAMLEAHKSLPANMQDTAYGYELAASRAAQSLGLLPKSKRAPDTEEISMPGARSAGAAPQKAKDNELSQEQLEFAHRLV